MQEYSVVTNHGLSKDYQDCNEGVMKVQAMANHSGCFLPMGSP